ncbi:MAG: TIGR02996 domain-containing protein, partial [Gemmataceae bacterium]|nr:TIGR02996 domain-containing protein [Gemmataceae bacterium]
MLSDRDALLAAIRANPDEDTPRLAFADWLDEHGDEADRARAEFIRVQCELARHEDESTDD